MQEQLDSTSEGGAGREQIEATKVGLGVRPAFGCHFLSDLRGQYDLPGVLGCGEGGSNGEDQEGYPQDSLVLKSCTFQEPVYIPCSAQHLLLYG